MFLRLGKTLNCNTTVRSRPNFGLLNMLRGTHEGLGMLQICSVQISDQPNSEIYTESLTLNHDAPVHGKH